MNWYQPERFCVPMDNKFIVEDISTVMHAFNWENLTSIMASKRKIPGGVAKVTKAKPKGDYGPGGHKASGRKQTMFSLFARGDMRKIAGSRDSASLMAVFNPRRWLSSCAMTLECM